MPSLLCFGSTRMPGATPHQGHRVGDERLSPPGSAGPSEASCSSLPHSRGAVQRCSLKIAIVIKGDIVICLWGWQGRPPSKTEPQSGMLPQPCLPPSVPESFGGSQGLGNGRVLGIMNVTSVRAWGEGSY